MYASKKGSHVASHHFSTTFVFISSEKEFISSPSLLSSASDSLDAIFADCTLSSAARYAHTVGNLSCVIVWKIFRLNAHSSHVPKKSNAQLSWRARATLLLNPNASDNTLLTILLPVLVLLIAFASFNICHIPLFIRSLHPTLHWFSLHDFIELASSFTFIEENHLRLSNLFLAFT